MAEVINPAIVPKVTLPSGEQVPCVGMGTFGSDRVSAEDVSAAVAGAIRIRSYKRVGKKVLYSSWSTVKKIWV